MKKIGLVSCYFKDNYGSQLQAYATQKILEDYGYEVETIDISKNKDFSNGKKKYYLGQIFNFNFIKTKFGMIKLKVDKKINKELGKNINVRNKRFKEFKKIYDLTPAYESYSKLNEVAKEYEAIVVGSDQLWLPVNVVADYYTLNWVPDDVKKISYSTSFGVSIVPDKYKEQYKKFLNRIDYLSTREDAGKEIIKNITDRDAKVVCDPTLLFNKDEWMSIQEEKPIYEDKYILCYFLGNSIEYRKFAERLKEKTGCKIVSLNHCDEYVKYSDEFADETPYDIGPGEFLNLIRNAEYVCTDSFHGTVFSLINNKKFFCFRRHNKKSKNSTNSRLDSLLGRVNLEERLLEGNEEIDDVLKMKINFNVVNEKLEEFRNESKKFLEDSLNVKEYQEELKKNTKKYIVIENKAKCSGCTACYSICPQNAIEMKEDEEGFLYPKVNMDKCINCSLCKNICPVLNSKENKKDKHAYIFQHKDDNVRRESTSGGAFTAIAKYILDKNGIVFGACFDDEFNVIHKGIEDKNELWRFRNSKYVQSNLLDTFKEVKANLENDRYVCYSGTSCQIEGLKRYLQKDYEKLILVDVVCRAVPSPLVWKKYLELRKKEYKNISKIMFRDKYYGYKYSNFSIYNKDNDKKNEYHSGVETDPYLRAFFSNICDRPSCYECKFKKDNRESDITIWDCFEVEKYNKDFDDDKGTTRLLTNSQKGYNIIKELKDNNNIKEITVHEALNEFNHVYNRVRKNTKRNQFFEDLKNKEIEDVLDKYFPNTIKCKIEKYSRLFLIKLGIYKPLLKLGKRIRKRV